MIFDDDTELLVLLNLNLGGADLTKVVIIGAGAAGLMAAVQCCLRGVKPELYDSQSKIGKKILISGGGRCNITNGVMSEKNFNGSASHFIRHVLSQFTEKDTLAFFEKRGVPLKFEDEFKKYFPVSDKAGDILNAFTSLLEVEGVRIHTDKKLASLEKIEANILCRFVDGDEVLASIVIMATGGLSVPQTGSDGSGFAILKDLGHSTTKLFPALAPLNSKESLLKNLKGYSSIVRMDLMVADKKIVSFTGPLLFTHFGYSGPVVLNISRHYFSEESKLKKIQVSWVPDLSENELSGVLMDTNQAKQNLSSVLRKYLSKNLVETLLSEAEIPLDLKLNNLSKPFRKKVLETFCRYPLPVDGSRGFAVAEATAGGIPVSEVQHGTLESKKCPNLFFCGEILDVDGQLGGYNFQWAFASANTVATAVLKACRKLNSE